MYPPLKIGHRSPYSAPDAAIGRVCFVSATACLAVALAAMPGYAQPTAQQPSPTAPVHAHRQAHPAKHSTPAQAPAPDTAQAAAQPEPPPTPKWPAFDQPTQASVVWDSHGLEISAANSSLTQILKDVSTATGVEIQGVNADQRVFGVFGPGSARDVLSQVLQGSGYNVIMVGDQGQGVPRELLLSARQSRTQQAAVRNTPTSSDSMNNNNDDDDTPDDQPMPIQQEAPPIHPGYQPGVPPRSPQQILQEMQQRQQQQSQQPGQPPN